MIPIRKNNGTVVGEYNPSTNIFMRDRKDSSTLNLTHLKDEDDILKFTHLQERNASTFDEHLITNIKKAVVDSGNNLDTLVLVDNVKELNITRSISYKDFLTHTDNLKKLFLHRGRNPHNYKQYEILIRHMKEANGKA